MSLAARAEPLTEWRWLYSPRFDLFFILGFLTIAVTIVATVMRQPALFFPILLADLWLLGYHHVISTYTRLCFDRESFARWHSLMFLLPVIALATIALAWLVGVWAVFSLYFYWQWWHYTRQSWGISRAYRAKDREALYEDGWLDQAIFYSLPILGILYRSSQGPAKFLGLDLAVLAIPGWLTAVSSLITVSLLLVWIWRRFQAWSEGRLARTHTLYMATHFLVFGVAYILIPDITLGWMLVNIWHNGQYILFVWMFNTRRFASGVDPKARFLSYISQRDRFWLYMAVCLAITGILYAGVLNTVDTVLALGLTGTIVIYQIVNFHHYIVDMMIWKVRKGPVKETLGL
jgi:hypothetical protein